MKAYLMHRDEHAAYGVAEWWKTGDGNILYVEFRADVCATAAFPYDMERGRVKSRNEIGVWHRDMTGGMAMRGLGYEPVGEDEDGTG